MLPRFRPPNVSRLESSKNIASGRARSLVCPATMWNGPPLAAGISVPTMRIDFCPPPGSFKPPAPMRSGADQATPVTDRATSTIVLGMVPSFPSRIWVLFGVIQTSASVRSTNMVLRKSNPMKSAIWKFERITAKATPTRVPASLSLSCQSMDTPSRAIKRRL